MKTEIFVFCEQTIERLGISYLLKESKGLSVVLETNSVDKLIGEIYNKNHGVVIFDPKEINKRNEEPIRRIKKQCPGIKVIVLSSFFNISLALNLRNAGADAFLVKTCTSKDLVHTINFLINNNSKGNAENFWGGKSLEDYYKLSETSGKLTSREIQILKMVASGKTTKQISSDLKISHRSVDVHRKNISRKIGVKGIPGFTKYALQMELITL